MTVRRADFALAHASVAFNCGPALAGVIHAAGVLDDGVITEQTAERFEQVAFVGWG